LGKIAKQAITIHNFYNNRNPATSQLAGFYKLFDENQLLLVA